MQQRGFTLIELIIVIVILGILAVTAAPRFIDLQTDARAATLEGVRAALQGGSQLVYARSAIEGEQATAAAGDATTQVDVGGATVETDFGYPDAEAATTGTLNGWVDISVTGANADFVFIDESAGDVNDGEFIIAVNEDVAPTTKAESGCYVQYEEAANANSTPTITVVSTGC